jgi:hypothetical protein
MINHWESFGNAWNKILDRDPILPYWHQSSARDSHRKPKNTPFSALTDKEIDRRERSLAKLIFKNREILVPFIIRTPHALVDAHVRGRIAPHLKTRKERKGKIVALESPQFITAFVVAKAMVKMMDGVSAITGKTKMPISIYFEERKDDPYEIELRQMWKFLKRNFPLDRDFMGDLDFLPGKSRHTPYLQAADMLAWHVNKKIQNPNGPNDPMWDLVTGCKYLPATMTKAYLDDYVRDINRDLRP